MTDAESMNPARDLARLRWRSQVVDKALDTLRLRSAELEPRHVQQLDEIRAAAQAGEC